MKIYVNIVLADDDDSLDTSNDNQLSSNLRVLRKTRRQNRYNAYGVRSKYVVVPNQIKEARTHSIPSNGKSVGTRYEGTIRVPPNVGFLHHYRYGCQKQEWEIVNCDSSPSHVDRTVHKYMEKLLHNIKKVVFRLSDQCKLNHLVKLI